MPFCRYTLQNCNKLPTTITGVPRVSSASPANDFGFTGQSYKKSLLIHILYIICLKLIVLNCLLEDAEVPFHNLGVSCSCSLSIQPLHKPHLNLLMILHKPLNLMLPYLSIRIGRVYDSFSLFYQEFLAWRDTHIILE